MSRLLLPLLLAAVLAATPSPAPAQARKLPDGALACLDSFNGRRHWCPVYAVAFAPDGKTLALAAGKGNEPPGIWLWEAGSGKEPRRLAVVADGIRSVCFAPDGKTLASVPGWDGKTGTTRLWDVATGKELPAGAARRGSAGTKRHARGVEGAARTRGRHPGDVRHAGGPCGTQAAAQRPSKP